MQIMPRSSEAPRTATLVVGAVLGALTLGMATLVVLACRRVLEGAWHFELSAFVLLALLVALTYFLGAISWRLVMNRPNKYQSVMGPLGWRLMATFWFMVSMALVAISLREKDIRAIGAIGCGLVLAAESRRQATLTKSNAVSLSNKSLGRTPFDKVQNTKGEHDDYR